MTSDDQHEKRDEAWSTGNRAAYVHILRETLRQLDYGDLEAKKAQWIIEREAAVASLRSLCAEFGDNDWPNSLHLQDVLEKHLGAHLRAQT